MSGTTNNTKRMSQAIQHKISLEIMTSGDLFSTTYKKRSVY